MGVHFYKKPTPSIELQALKSLQNRTSLSAKHLQRLENARKGFLGERRFYRFLSEQLSSSCYVLCDLLLKANGTTFQIDSLILFHDTIYLIEVKYFEGDFFLRDEGWYAVASGKEIRNPLLQLKRSDYLLRQYLSEQRFRTTVKSFVVFVHPNFLLYEAPMKLPIIYPGQIGRFIRSMNSKFSRQVLPKYKTLARGLIHNHMDGAHFIDLPDYHFQELHKGIICIHCRDFINKVAYKVVRCQSCGMIEGVSSAVMRSVVEFNLLFPKDRITIQRIYVWLGRVISKDRIRRILRKYMHLLDRGKYSHYLFE